MNQSQHRGNSIQKNVTKSKKKPCQGTGQSSLGTMQMVVASACLRGSLFHIQHQLLHKYLWTTAVLTANTKGVDVAGSSGCCTYMSILQHSLCCIQRPGSMIKLRVCDHTFLFVPILKKVQFTLESGFHNCLIM